MHPSPFIKWICVPPSLHFITLSMLLLPPRVFWGIQSFNTFPLHFIIKQLNFGGRKEGLKTNDCFLLDDDNNLICIYMYV